MLRSAGVLNLTWALVSVFVVATSDQSGGLVDFFRVFNAVLFSALTVIWIALELVQYRARKRSRRHEGTSEQQEQ